MPNARKKFNIPNPAETPTVGIPEASRMFGLGRSKGYELARSGHFPVPVLQLGNQFRVPTAHLIELLGLGGYFSTGDPGEQLGASEIPTHRGN